MRLEDARRLTGPNLFGPRPLVLAEVVLEPGDTAESVRSALQAETARMRAALGLSPVTLKIVRTTENWIALAHEAPLDEMLVGAEILEWAATGGALQPKAQELETMLADAREPALPTLEAEAARRGLPFLWDDEQVSVGYGKKCVQYARHAIPREIPWDSLGSIPIALVTGTNGKTTSTRLLARMVQEAGLAVGLCCSDSVTIAGRSIREGDWTGPAAARLVLRSPDVEVAVLETARGGILRRGLACDAADVALLTNVSDDHLGAYGIESLEDMAQVKAVIARAVRSSGTVVLNARDPRLVALAPGFEAQVAWFADLEGGVGAAVFGGKRAVVARGGQVISITGDTEQTLLPVASIPITFGGTARYNVENALGAVAAAEALGLPHAAIIKALQSFGAADNPGRGETWRKDGITVFLDFAHNPDGVAWALHVASSLGGRLTVITGSAGDRSDAELKTIIERIQRAKPVHIFVRELEHYLRGRQPGEVPAIFLNALRETGVTLALSEVDALERALKTSAAGDAIALLVHVDRDEVGEFLQARGWQRG